MFTWPSPAVLMAAALLPLTALPASAGADLAVGPILLPAVQYKLLGTPDAPGYVGRDPIFFVALNPQPLPPRIAPPISLDLRNPLEPVYTNQEAGQIFGAVFGIDNGVCSVPFGAPNFQGDGAFSFHPPQPCMPFSIGLTVPNLSPGDLVAVNPQPLPPRQFSVAELAFSQGASADPMMSFTLDFNPPSGGALIPFRFSPIPEPAGILSLGLGLAVLAGTRRKR